MAISGIYGNVNHYLSETKFIENNKINHQTQAALPENSDNIGDASEKQNDNEKFIKAPKISNPSEFIHNFKHSSDIKFVTSGNLAEDNEVEKAVSTMHQDDLLDQYKYFVGNQNLGTDADGTVRLKNN